MSTIIDPDSQAIAANVQREVERAALRKVRKLTDRLENEQRKERQLQGIAQIIIWFLAAISTLIVVALIVHSMGPAMPEPAEIQIPVKNLQSAKP